jgi:Hydrazine synthase alpha subunit middle domain
MATMRTAAKIGLLATGMGIAVGACSKDTGSGGPVPPDVTSIMFLQRIARTDTGNVFDYTSYQPGARLVTLTPPSADGKLEVLTKSSAALNFDTADIMSYDLSFDAKAVVFSAKLTSNDRFHLYSMNLDGSNLQQLTMGDDDYVYPIYVPGQKILFMTSKSVEENANQFRDEYERQTTAQVGTINLDGTAETLGPRNVSHRVAPTLLPNGRVVYTEWRHMGNVNDGHLRMMNEDMTGMREAFGGEDGGNGGTNSYLKARVVQTTTTADGTTNYQMIAIGTSRDRTLQAGKLLLINLNGSEELSKFTDLTPLVPGDRTPSALGVGRFYDAEVIGQPNDQKFLTSWADGPVESEILGMANSNANFGIYVYSAKTQQRFPIFDDPAYWDVLARPIKARAEPAPTSSPISGTSTTVGALNVYDSSLATIAPGSIVKVRLIEGFSGEEGIRTFGSTEFDGQSLYGEVAVNPDNSFAAKVPGNVPFHMQVIDKFALSQVNESIWISGRAGEQRFCGGCHENRSVQSPIAPGVQENVLRGAVNLDVPRPQRVSTDYSYGAIRGVPWDLAIQPMLTAKCATCHDGDASKPGNPSYTVTDRTTMTSQTFTFDLRAEKLAVTVGEKMSGDFSASYISLMGLGEMLGEDVVDITEAHPGDYQPNGYVSAGSAKDSTVIQMLNPPQRFPGVDMNVRAMTKIPAAAKTCTAMGASPCVHPTEVGGAGLTADEFYRLILSIDMGGQYFSRENKDEAITP